MSETSTLDLTRLLDQADVFRFVLKKVSLREVKSELIVKTIKWMGFTPEVELVNAFDLFFKEQAEAGAFSNISDLVQSETFRTFAQEQADLYNNKKAIDAGFTDAHDEGDIPIVTVCPSCQLSYEVRIGENAAYIEE